jgi:hypothetical protein
MPSAGLPIGKLLFTYTELDIMTGYKSTFENADAAI